MNRLSSLRRVSHLLAALVLPASFFTSASNVHAETQSITSFWGLSLGQAESDVIRLKGRPGLSGGISGPCKSDPTDLASYTEQWAYNDDGGTYYVRLRHRRIWSIAFYALKGIAPDIPIGAFGDSQNTLEAKLGQPSLISDSSYDDSRWLVFEKYSAAYQLRNGHVVMFAIYDPRQGTVRFCD
jgi:hypothetical protein